jgi:release factor glutamine methyltransferase
MVVSNPPYVPALDQTTIQREVRDYEPPVALYGGDDGLDVYRRLVPEAQRLLKPAGWLMMELGYAVVDPVRAMLADWREVEIVGDLAGLPRVVIARRP